MFLFPDLFRRTIKILQRTRIFKTNCCLTMHIKKMTIFLALGVEIGRTCLLSVVNGTRMNLTEKTKGTYNTSDHVFSFFPD